MRPPPPSGAPSTSGSGASALSVLVPAALDVVVGCVLSLTRGTLTVTRERKGPIVGASGIEVVTSLSRVGSALLRPGAGSRSRPSASRSARRSGNSRPRSGFGDGDLTPAPLSGRLADGALGGQVTVHLVGPTRYAISLDLSDARAEALMSALGARSLSGRLRAQASPRAAEGVTGQGHAEIRDGHPRVPRTRHRRRCAGPPPARPALPGRCHRLRGRG